MVLADFWQALDQCSSTFWEYRHFARIVLLKTLQLRGSSVVLQVRRIRSSHSYWWQAHLLSIYEGTYYSQQLKVILTSQAPSNCGPATTAYFSSQSCKDLSCCQICHLNGYCHMLLCSHADFLYKTSFSFERQCIFAITVNTDSNGRQKTAGKQIYENQRQTTITQSDINEVGGRGCGLFVFVGGVFGEFWSCFFFGGLLVFFWVLF